MRLLQIGVQIFNAELVSTAYYGLQRVEEGGTVTEKTVCHIRLTTGEQLEFLEQEAEEVWLKLIALVGGAE